MLLPALLMALRIASGTPEAPFRQPQLATDGQIIGVAFGAGNSVYFARSADQGATFSKPVLVSNQGRLSLGMHRGPRLAITPEAIVISAVTGEKGRGADGDIVAWRSTDGGATWSAGVPVNDVPASAREGLHAMSYGGGLLYAAWLDLRSKGTRIYGSQSRDGGQTWSKNTLVYESPSGTVCQCCHPTVAIDDHGRLYVMFRNAVDGARDMYLVGSADGGRTFSNADRMGEGTWLLEACPMDGGGLAFDQAGGAVTVWRRKQEIYLARPGQPERPLGSGKDASVAVSPRGVYVAWTSPKGVLALVPDRGEPAVVSPDGGYAQLLSLPSGKVLAAWETKAGVSLEILP